MATFEERLQDSAKRIAKKDRWKLSVPPNPLEQRRTYWGWIATPAAAVAGILIGLFLPTFIENNRMRTTQTIDTVHIVQSVHDTLYISKTTIPATRPEVWNESMCTSVTCDGIDYSISDIYRTGEPPYYGMY